MRELPTAQKAKSHADDVNERLKGNGPLIEAIMKARLEGEYKVGGLDLTVDQRALLIESGYTYVQELGRATYEVSFDDPQEPPAEESEKKD